MIYNNSYTFSLHIRTAWFYPLTLPARRPFHNLKKNAQSLEGNFSELMQFLPL